MTRYHVTRLNGPDVYGHNAETCDAHGCAGYERYLGTRDQLGPVELGKDVAVGAIVERDEIGEDQ